MVRSRARRRYTRRFRDMSGLKRDARQYQAKQCGLFQISRHTAQQEMQWMRVRENKVVLVKEKCARCIYVLLCHVVFRSRSQKRQSHMPPASHHLRTYLLLCFHIHLPVPSRLLLGECLHVGLLMMATLYHPTQPISNLRGQMELPIPGHPTLLVLLTTRAS